MKISLEFFFKSYIVVSLFGNVKINSTLLLNGEIIIFFSKNFTSLISCLFYNNNSKNKDALFEDQKYSAVYFLNKNYQQKQQLKNIVIFIL